MQLARKENKTITINGLNLLSLENNCILILLLYFRNLLRGMFFGVSKS